MVQYCLHKKPFPIKLMKKRFLLDILLVLITTVAISQSCTVSVDALKDQYTGDCKKGKADGNGTATGTDSYSGHFKNGYPDGEGKYTWKNGNWYSGSWRNGLFDGKGTFSKKKDDNPDSVLVMTGYWRKGNYIGRNEKPYDVTTLTNNINDVNVRKINSAESTITITVKSITGGAADMSNSSLPKCRLVDIQLIEGRFDQQLNDETSSTVTNKYILRGVTFPFYATFSFETPGAKQHVERVNIEIKENSNWFVQVSIDN